MCAPPEDSEGDAGRLVSAESLRLAEALVFASDRPVTEARLQSVLAPGQHAEAVLAALAEALAGRGVHLAAVAGGYALRTAPDLAPVLTRVVEVPKRLPRAAMEALAVIAWHQPCTRAEIEDIRGASLAQSSLEALLDLGLVAPRGQKEVPGRPTLWGTTPRFLEQFGLTSLKDLPKREELVSGDAAAPLFAKPSADPAA
jgi:segregation and condensation protein B